MSYTVFTKEEKASWPDGYKKCRGCHEVLPFVSFHKHKQALFGYANYCKICRKPAAKAHWKSKSFERTLWEQAKGRAKLKGLPFDLELEDITIPEKCPVLGVEIERVRHSPYAPSLDQVRPAGGYTKNNIVVMSRRANTLKNNMSKEEAILLSDWINRNCN